MKKAYSLLLLALLSWGVSQARPVDPQRAMQVARHFVAARVPRADVSNPVVAYAHPMPSGDGVAMYAVNVAGCFVMVAADDVAHPVLGYSLSRPWPMADKEGGKQQKEDKAHRSYPPPCC